MHAGRHQAVTHPQKHTRRRAQLAADAFLPRMTLAAIAAMNPQRIIGRDNDLPWHLPADLAYFKRVTKGHPVILGRKCFESVGRPLPGRVNIVLTRRRDWSHPGVRVAHDRASALAMAREAAAEMGVDAAFNCGGEEIYRLLLPDTDRVYLTEIEVAVEGGDTFFPELPTAEWQLCSEEAHAPDERNRHAYTYRVYERRG